MMDYAQLRSLVGQGHSIGSHTLTHPNVAYLELEAAHRELAESKHRLEEALKSPIPHFSYPCPALSPSLGRGTDCGAKPRGRV